MPSTSFANVERAVSALKVLKLGLTIVAYALMVDQFGDLVTGQAQRNSAAAMISI